MSIKKTILISILFFSLLKVEAAETANVLQDVSQIIASISPNLPELSPDTYAFLQEERKIVSIPLDQLPDDFTKGIKLYYGLGIQKDETESRKYLIRAFNSNKNKYKNALVLIGLMDLQKGKIDEAFEKLYNSWKLKSFYGLSKILVIAMRFYEHPRFNKFAEVLKDPAIENFLKLHANPLNADGGQPDMQYVLSYACFSCNKCELIHVTEDMGWHCLITLINTHRSIPALALIAEQSLFDENKARQMAALDAARVAHIFNLPIGHYYYGLAICAGLIKGKTFDEGIALIKKSRDEWIPDAYHVLGDFALQGVDGNGNAVDVDYQKALDSFQQGAERGDLLSEYNLATMYLKGLGTPQDTDKGEALLKKILTKTAFCDVQLNIVKGLIYQHGAGSYGQDLEKAKEFYKKAGTSSEVKRLLKKVDLEIAEKAQAELLAAEQPAASSAKKKAKSKIKSLKTLSIAEQISAPEEESVLLSEDIDIAAQRLISKLNSGVKYSDGSIITAFDTYNKIVTIVNPVDNSKVIIELEKMPAVTDKMLKELQMFTYQQRIKDFFSEKNNLLASANPLSETVVRHTFAERVDQIVQLYGKRYYFMTDKGTIKNYALFGKIVLADGSEYEGAFEYAFADNSETIVYHRFLHPRSRITAEYQGSSSRTA